MKSGNAWAFVVASLLAGCSSSSDDGPGAGTGGTGSVGSGGGSAAGGGSGGGSAAGGGSGGGSAAGGGSGGGGGTALPAKCDSGPLTQWEQMMLDKHNAWRASVNPPAANMYRVYWDTSIAQNAANWVSSCDPDWPHSPEGMRSGIGGYKVLGENLSYCGGSACGAPPGVTDGSGEGDGEGWWDERHDYRITPPCAADRSRQLRAQRARRRCERA